MLKRDARTARWTCAGSRRSGHRPLKGPAVTSTYSSSCEAQCAARKTVRETSSRFLSEPVGMPWVREICWKVGSIVRKEVVPLLPSRMADRDRKHLMQSVGSVLGVTYLADYALESRFRFQVDDAAEYVLSAARTLGVDEHFAYAEIRRLKDLYRYERNAASGRNSARSAETRYLLKCSDVVFVQLMALHASEEGVKVSTERALRCAGAALDAYDDLLDRDEDVGSVLNPFAGVSAPTPSRRHRLFRELVSPFMESVKMSAATASDGVVGRYCCQVLSRLGPLSEFPDDPVIGARA